MARTKTKSGPKGPTKPLDDKDWERLINMVRIQCTREEICNIFDMTEKTLNSRISERGEGNFSLLYKKYGDEGKASLRRMQWKSANGGNVSMQIFLGKQMLGQTDKTQHSGDQDNPLQFEYIERRIVKPKGD